MTEDQIRKLKFDGWPLPDDYLIELGRITSLWELLDSFLETCLGKLAGFNKSSDPTPFILLAHTNSPQRLDMLGALCEHLAPMYPYLAGYPEVLSSIKAAQKLRNKFVHNTMGRRAPTAIICGSQGGPCDPTSKNDAGGTPAS